MWVDENDVIHTVSVPPGAILGEESVLALQTVEDDAASATIDGINARYDDIFESAMADAPAGPTDIVDIDVDELPYPPCYAGPVPQPGESLTSTVMRFLDGVPPQWRLEAFEAVYDALERDDAATDS